MIGEKPTWVKYWMDGKPYWVESFVEGMLLHFNFSLEDPYGDENESFDYLPIKIEIGDSNVVNTIIYLIKEEFPDINWEQLTYLQYAVEVIMARVLHDAGIDVIFTNDEKD